MSDAVRYLEPEAERGEWGERRRQPPPLAAHAGAVLTPAAVEALQRTAGNQAVARLVAANGPGPPGRLLQRVILQMRSPGDTDAATNELGLSVELLQRKGSRGSVHRVDGPDDFPDLSKLARTETVYLLSHSEGVKVGGLDAKDLAAKLAKTLPAGYAGKIVLVACHSADEKPNPAFRGPLAKLGPTMSYARYLAYFLNAQKTAKDATPGLAVREVQGRVGISTLDPVTGARRSLPEAVSGEPKRRLDAWSAPHDAAVKRLHAKLSEVKTDAEKKGNWVLGSKLFGARKAIGDEWIRAWEHKLSLIQLDVGAHTGTASTVGYAVGPTAPRINRPAPPAAGATADAHARVEQRLIDHLAELDPVVADIVLKYSAGDHAGVTELCAGIVQRVAGWAGVWTPPNAAPTPAPAAAPSGGGGTDPAPAIAVDTMVVTLPPSSSAAAGTPATTSTADA